MRNNGPCFPRFPFRGMNPANAAIPQIAAEKIGPILGCVIQAIGRWKEGFVRGRCSIQEFTIQQLLKSV